MKGIEMQTPCAIEACGQPVKARGLCLKHYTRLQRHGDPLVLKWPRPEERFLAKKVIDDSGCWLWIGHVRRGYGLFWVGGRDYTAHRWAYEHWRGPIPERFTVDHLCRVRLCVNPDHLEAVTNAENVRRGIRAHKAAVI